MLTFRTPAAVSFAPFEASHFLVSSCCCIIHNARMPLLLLDAPCQLFSICSLFIHFVKSFYLMPVPLKIHCLLVLLTVCGSLNAYFSCFCELLCHGSNGGPFQLSLMNISFSFLYVFHLGCLLYCVFSLYLQLLLRFPMDAFADCVSLDAFALYQLSFSYLIYFLSLLLYQWLPTSLYIFTAFVVLYCLLMKISVMSLIEMHLPLKFHYFLLLVFVRGSFFSYFCCSSCSCVLGGSLLLVWWSWCACPEIQIYCYRFVLSDPSWDGQCSQGLDVLLPRIISVVAAYLEVASVLPFKMDLG